MAVNPADYYRSLDDAETYFSQQLFATDWTTDNGVARTDDSKEKALLAATRAIDSVRFRGYKVPVYNVLYSATGDLLTAPTQEVLETADASQSHKWPRDGTDFAVDTPETSQSLLAYSVASTTGNVTITLTVSGVAYTTAEIAHDANAATIQTAIDAAVTLSGYQAGDIAVSGGPLTSSAVVLAFTGSSVSGVANSTRPVVSAATGFDGTLEVVSGSATVSGECPDRIFYAMCEEAISLLSGRDPQQEFCNSILNSDGVGSTRVSTDTTTSPQHTAHMFTSPLAWKYLIGFLGYDNNSFEVLRS